MSDWSIVAILLPAFCECLVLVGIHAYLGIHVIKRQIIFVDLALAQIAALGALIAFLFGMQPHTWASYWFSLGLATMGAGIFTVIRNHVVWSNPPHRSCTLKGFHPDLGARSGPFPGPVTQASSLPMGCRSV